MREKRLIRWFKEMGSNFEQYRNELTHTYLTGPYQTNDTIQKITGPIMAAASVILEGPNRLVDGITDTPPEHRTGLRTTLHTGQFLKNVVTLHPIRALNKGAQVLFNDWILDIGDAIGGFQPAHHARASAHRLLNDEAGYRLAA